MYTLELIQKTAVYIFRIPRSDPIPIFALLPTFAHSHFALLKDSMFPSSYFTQRRLLNGIERSYYRCSVAAEQDESYGRG